MKLCLLGATPYGEDTHRAAGLAERGGVRLCRRDSRGAQYEGAGAARGDAAEAGHGRWRRGGGRGRCGAAFGAEVALELQAAATSTRATTAVPMRIPCDLPWSRACSFPAGTSAGPCHTGPAGPVRSFAGGRPPASPPCGPGAEPRTTSWVSRTDRTGTGRPAIRVDKRPAHAQTERIGRQMDRGEGRVEVGGQRDVVEPDDGHLLGHAHWWARAAPITPRATTSLAANTAVNHAATPDQAVHRGMATGRIEVGMGDQPLVVGMPAPSKAAR